MCVLMAKICFRLVWLTNFFNRPQTKLVMSRDCSSRKDYSQELPRFNQKRLEKCYSEKRQLHQPKPAAVETVDLNRETTLAIYWKPYLT